MYYWCIIADILGCDDIKFWQNIRLYIISNYTRNRTFRCRCSLERIIFNDLWYNYEVKFVPKDRRIQWRLGKLILATGLEFIIIWIKTTWKKGSGYNTYNRLFCIMFWSEWQDKCFGGKTPRKNMFDSVTILLFEKYFTKILS